MYLEDNQQSKYVFDSVNYLKMYFHLVVRLPFSESPSVVADKRMPSEHALKLSLRWSQRIVQVIYYHNRLSFSLPEEKLLAFLIKIVIFVTAHITLYTFVWTL